MMSVNANKASRDQDLSGAHITLVGVFDGTTSHDAARRLKARGATIDPKVSERTDVLLYGDPPAREDGYYGDLHATERLNVKRAPAASLHALLAGKNLEEALRAKSLKPAVDEASFDPEDALVRVNKALRRWCRRGSPSAS